MFPPPWSGNSFLLIQVRDCGKIGCKRGGGIQSFNILSRKSWYFRRQLSRGNRKWLYAEIRGWGKGRELHTQQSEMARCNFNNLLDPEDNPSSAAICFSGCHKSGFHKLWIWNGEAVLERSKVSCFQSMFQV